MLFQRFTTLLVIVLLTGCASRGQLSPLIDNVPTSGTNASIHNIFIATSREMAATKAEFLSGNRSTRLKYFDLNISIPNNRERGEIQWASGKADPDKHFALLNYRKIAGKDQFRRALNHALAQKPPGDKAIFIFIHGFNNTFAESLFRLAQLKKDVGINAVTIGYSWPSKGKASRYIYDRDSVAFARDQLESVLETAANTNTRRIYILAHSLGSWLTMEALRQHRISGKRKLFSKLSALALAAPDIDQNVFNSQLSRLRPLHKPFFILTSQKDRALGFLRFFTGETQRVGKIKTSALLERYGIRILDISCYEGGDRLGHSGFATSPTFLDLFQKWVARASGRKVSTKIKLKSCS